MHTRRFRKADGRRLILYGTHPHDLPPQPEGPAAPGARPHLRRHPLRDEWVIYAAHRQQRTHLPPAASCPLCPTRPGGGPTEIPFEAFEVAVFENRFPALVAEPDEPPPLPVETAPGMGACEVVVYTPDHEGSLATLLPARRELLVRVWADRCRELYGYDAVECVMPFENRGEAVGVTLHHPHGQVYAYPFVPPILRQEAEAFARVPALEELLAGSDGRYLVEDDGATIAAVPPFARFPFEVWVVPRRRQPGLWTLTDAEVASLAGTLGRIVARYDALFHRPLPYVMAVHTAPRGAEEQFHVHVEFTPLQRGSNRLKYLAGTELGAGAFAVDVLPEEAARALRRAGP